MKPSAIRKIPLYAVLTVWGALCLYPLLWMIGASLKDPMDVMSSYSLLPNGVWHWDTYVDVWNKMKFFHYFLNSVNVTFFTILGINVLFTMAGFAFAKLRFPGSNMLFLGFLGMMFVPGITVMVPLYLTEHSLGLLNTHLGLILPMVNGSAPMALFLFRNYFRTIPHELYETAKLEGAGILRILYRIYIPLAIPAIATITIMNFLGSWNSLVLPMVLLNSQHLYTLPLAVMLLDTGVFRQWNVLMAGSLITIVPVILCFFLLQKYFIQGLTSGAIKS
ncbi:carbohydrate ABC transporter permease [Paenibacillus sacheonensis]|uniref:ABC transporter permease subunit n=1 Tax=Paenibacillus sacheonensis TaxID=742054 RepID=A0A7X4YL39_9BACL|nr:carbohydrate ABC transporter permease [Paenibacillus sacheonensis]MBM7568793.1 ABC-type glycerol-3-phosphate transport system permease component [Paenibacillus sacheonensis]NBC68375.1 ABC transporter permease subunit [Paenibacillus sacheonensis]